jgi:hypothetical protein
MANAIYPNAKKQMLQGGIDLSSVNVKALLVNVSGGGTTYTYSASHEFLSDSPSGARIAVSGSLASTTFGNDGSFDSDDPTFSGVTGDSIESIVLYIDTGTAGTSRLIMYQDTDVTGLPLTPDGSDAGGCRRVVRPLTARDLQPATRSGRTFLSSLQRL